MYLIKERRPLFLFGYYWKTQTPELRTAMGPKEHKQMEFRTQQRIRKKGERHNNKKALKQVKLLLLLLLLLLLDWNSINKGVCHTVALPIYIKKYLKAKEELWKLKYFTMQKYDLQNNPLKQNQKPSRCSNSITNLKFQHNLAKIYQSSFKNPHIKIDLLFIYYLVWAKNPLSYYTLYKWI